MSKCIGCGVTLQDKFPLEDGYVSNLEHNLCERCFMIRNYNKNKVINKSNDAKERLKNIDISSDVDYFYDYPIVYTNLSKNLEKEVKGK